jgi:hypothetical protein
MRHSKSLPVQKKQVSFHPKVKRNMKQAVTLTSAQREHYFKQLAPTDVEIVVVEPAQRSPVLEISERKPDASVQAKRSEMIRQEYARQQQLAQAQYSPVSRESGAITLLKLGSLGAGGALAWEIATAFNPTALAITAGVMAFVGLLTYPRKSQPREQPTWMPKNPHPVPGYKQANVNINPVINVSVNVQQ